MESFLQKQELRSGILITPTMPHIHMYHIPDFREAVHQIISTRPEKVILDLINVKYLDSSALGALFAISKDIQAYGGKFILIHLNQTIRMVFRLTRSDMILLTAENLEEAEKL